MHGRDVSVGEVQSFQAGVQRGREDIFGERGYEVVADVEDFQIVYVLRNIVEVLVIGRNKKHGKTYRIRTVNDELGTALSLVFRKRSSRIDLPAPKKISLLTSDTGAFWITRFLTDSE